MEGRMGFRARERGNRRHASTPPRLHASTPSRLSVHGDEGKLRQILINLLDNAVKFTASGKVRLKIAQLRPPSLEAGDSPPLVGEGLRKGLCRFEVMDTGVGISPQLQARIFEPFTQSEAGAKQGGTGLGLAITQKYIELMGGELAVASEVGVGSRFSFTIPLPQATGGDGSLSAIDEREIIGLADGHTVKAVVADDIKENRDVLAQMLRNLGAEVLPAENGQQALDLVRRNTLDIVFMDIRMPQMDGLQAMRRIVEALGASRPKIVAVSASALVHEREMFLEAGFDDFIPKPFQLERICECLSDLLEVEYEYNPAAQQAAQPRDFSQVVLPDELYARLRTDAERHSLTRLKRDLDEMAKLGDEARRLAVHLGELGQQGDMNEIMLTLDTIQRKT